MTGPDHATEQDTAGVVAPPPLIFASGLALGFLVEALAGSGDLPTAVAVPAGVLLVVAGLALNASFITSFRRARTAVEPWRPTSAIVTTGVYRLSRNPAYLGMALIYTGIAVLAGALWALVTLVPTLAVIDRGVIAREERYLERTFGEPYRAYRRTTRRWL